SADWICVDLQRKHFDFINDLSISRSLCVACSKDETISVWDLRPMLESPLIVTQQNQDQQEKPVLLCKIEDQSASRAIVSPFVTGVRGLPLLIGSIIYETDDSIFHVEGNDQSTVGAVNNNKNNNVLLSSKHQDTKDDHKSDSSSGSDEEEEEEDDDDDGKDNDNGSN
ncbi:hypothetical protein RFI_05204, partial [Reticulomyxa filosa]